MAFDFKLPEAWYSTTGAESKYRRRDTESWKEMRREYTRMRDTAQKRLKRLQESDFRWTVDGQKPSFPELKTLSDANFAKAFNQLYRFVKAQTTTVSGAKSRRSKTISSFRKQGLNLTKENYERVMKIFAQMRALKIVYDSEKVIEVAEFLMALSDDRFSDYINDHLETLLQHSDELKDIPEGYSEVDADDFIEQIGW